MSKHKCPPKITCHRWSYEARGDLLVAAQGGVERMRLPLAPLIEGKLTTIQAWRQPGPDHLVGTLDRGGSVHLAMDCGHLCYWMETDRKHFETLAYFPGLTFRGKYWQTYMSDAHDRKWDVDLDQEVGISSAYEGLSPFGADGEGMTDPGDFPPYWIWNVPVRAFSVQTGDGWAGFSMPGALPVGLVRLRMEQGKLSIHFDALRPACTDGKMPRVYLVTGLAGAYDVLEEHRLISDHLGLTVEKDRNHPAWWSHPEFNYWDEFCRLSREDPEGTRNQTILTAQRYLDWLNTTKQQLGLREMNCSLEQGCYRCYGDYRPTEAMGGVEGVRKMVDKLRAEGTHVGHYIHPYMVNTKVDFWKQHPEAFCKPKDPSHKSWWALEYGKEPPEFRVLDWTHPLTREFMAEQIKFLFSDEPGCLNCDIVCSYNWLSPDARLYQFHDPDWGIGDLMTYKAQRFIYETAKRIKPDCAVFKVSVADPYLQPWADVDYLCEEWNGYTDNWYRRARIATRTMPDAMLVTDSYFLTLTKGYEYYMGMFAWNLPKTPGVRHAVHPYTHYREMKAKDFKRCKSGFHTALHAPLRIGDVSRVNVRADGEVEQWRKRTEGVLAGFYAAIGIGKRTLVAYSETEACIATSITRTVEFPLPPGAKLAGVTMVPHEGEPREWPSETVVTAEGPGLRLHVEDCGQRARYYRVNYTLPG